MPRQHHDDNSDSENDSYSSDNSLSEDSRERRRHSKKKKSRKHKRKHKHRKKESKRRRRDHHDNDDSSSTRSRKRRRKDRKEKKRRRKTERDDKDHESGKRNRGHPTETKDVVARALCNLFATRPVFVHELPILLIRLAGGSTFNLGQMTDAVAAEGLHRVLSALEELGVQQESSTGEWEFQAPPGLRDERVLLRAIRSYLDDAGVTMEAVDSYESKLQKAVEEVDEVDEAPVSSSQPTRTPEKPSTQVSPTDDIRNLTSKVIINFQKLDAELGTQLAGLCQTIAEGECISIDGLPDQALKAALQQIFVECGLERSEMANDSDDDDEGEVESEFGYGLPDAPGEIVHLRLAAIMEACRNPKRPILGPMRPTEEQAAIAYSSEEEGPALPGEVRRDPEVSAAAIKAQAARRELELKATAAGVDIPTETGGREEWMVVPGKHDFFENIKAGQPIKSRGFRNKKTRGGDDEPETPIHPAIQAEMDAIFQAHKESRGMSLIDQHRAKKQQQKLEAAGKATEWKWNREKDLDSDRRVDKDALHLVLGGAADNLKTKFHGGLR